MRMPDEWRGVLLLPERRPRAFTAVAAALIAAAGVVLWTLVADNGVYPLGGQALGYIYRSEELLRQIQRGIWWPQIDLLQYNGVQPLRYAGPLSAYAYTAVAALAGDGIHAFVPFCVTLFVIGCLSWLVIGMRLHRGWLGLVLGPLWFLMPINLSTLFVDGDIPRACALCILPVLLWCAYSYLDRGRPRKLAVIAAAACALVLCDVTLAALIVLCFAVYLAIEGIICRRWARGVRVLCALACGVLCAGVWLVPSLVGDTSSLETPQLVSSAAQSLSCLLNPLARTSDTSAAYAGLGMVALALFGIVCARRRAMPGFWSACVVVLVSSQAACPVIDLFTDGANIGVARVLALAALFCLFSFALWRSLKTGIVVVVCLLLLADAAPSFNLIYGILVRSDPVERLQSHMDRALIDQAKAVCTQRLGLVGEDFFDAEVSYLVTGMPERIATSQGFTDQLSSTSYNYTQINQALAEGSFDYVFDRSMELGDDTVLLSTKNIPSQVEWTDTQIDQAAKAIGYELVAVQGTYRLYHMDTPATFGVIAAYRGLAIGSGAAAIARQFPIFEEASTAPLDSYSFDQLNGYDVIYLDGFTYTDRAAAERLVERLADTGVDVVIAADGIPNEEHSGQKTFLGLDCESITFTGGFPTIYTDGGPLETALFPSGYASWSTVYVNGLVNVLATIEEGSRTLPVCGTLANSHIKVVGLNLAYYESLTGDEGIARLLSKTIGVLPSECPERQVVELAVEQDGSTLTISSDADNADTTLAALDNMELVKGAARDVNSLVYADRGTTVIRLSTPWLLPGLVASLLGVAGAVVLCRQRG
mgnify:CR=1 FL=1